MTTVEVRERYKYGSFRFAQRGNGSREKLEITRLGFGMESIFFVFSFVNLSNCFAKAEKAQPERTDVFSQHVSDPPDGPKRGSFLCNIKGDIMAIWKCLGAACYLFAFIRRSALLISYDYETQRRRYVEVDTQACISLSLTCFYLLRKLRVRGTCALWNDVMLSGSNKMQIIFFSPPI